MIFVLWGEDKSCKNTLALSFPKPLVDLEFDIGGFERSCRNLPHLTIKDWYEQGLIKREQFIMPFQLGDIDPIKEIIRPSKIVVGMKELFYQFAAKFIGHLKDPNIKTIFVDTGTLLYEVTATGYLQEKQEAQRDAKGNLLLGEKPMLTLYPPVLYREVNIRMRGFLYQAKAHGKHLVMTHHASDEYGLTRLKDGTMGEGKTGKRVLHGWGQLGDGCDVLGHTYWKPTKINPSTKEVIEKGNSYFNVELAEVKELEGMIFKEPTFDKIDTTIKMMRGEA